MVELTELVSKALEAQQKSFSPYSKFRVGAALQTNDDLIYTGCNIESSSYGLTICAERVALFKAISEGIHSFKRMVVVTDANDFCPPCGACRQILWDFASTIEIILVNNNREQKVHKMSDLYPEAFDSDFLDKGDRRE